MKPHLLVLSILLLTFTLPAFSQDIILKKNDEMIKCKIKEVGLDEVKYLLPEYSQDVIFSIAKDNIKKIIFENGEEMAFEKDMNNPANYEDNYKNVLKIEFMAPLFGNTTLAWEHSLKPGRSIEATLGLAGLGLDMYDGNASGVFMKFGYKFIKSPDFYLRGMRYAHLLKGSYLKPEISMGLVGQNVWHETQVYDQVYQYWYYTSESSRESVFAAALQLVIGKQWVFDNAFSIDGHFGLGYGFNTATGDHVTYHSGFVAGNGDAPISVSGGLKIGLLIK